MYYVYELIDPRNNKVFYVGKGKYKRMYYHYNIVNNNKNLINKHLENKLKQLINENLKPKYKKIFESENEQECFKKEIKKIKEIGKENLCNLTNGGESNGGFIFSEKTKLLKSKQTSGSGNPMYGKKHNPETIEKIRNKMLEKNSHKEYRDMISNKTKKAMTEEVKLKCSTGMKGKKQSKEAKEKISNGNKGKKRTEEAKRKYSENMKKRWKDPTERKELIWKRNHRRIK